MASLYATALRLPSPMKPNNLGACNLKLTSPVALRTAFRMRRSSCLEVCCAAKAETVERVAEIVKKTLALSEGTEVTAGSKFADLGADSLDTVEIVMAIEENFDVSVEEESSQNIATVQDVAELIEELVQKKAAAV